MTVDDRFSLKDHLFNPTTIAQVAGEFSQGIPGFDGEAYQAAVLGGFEDRELLQRIDWMADCLEPYLPRDFNGMADFLEASLAPELDGSRSDDDFGKFIHAVPGILAVRHGLEHHRDRALDLIYTATKRFSMEFYIRPFLNRWPEETLARLHVWVRDENYHVRRLVSEGTRPKLPWAKAVTLAPDQTLPLLDQLHADGTRYVTRSVANHLNDLTKTSPDLVFDRLQAWAKLGDQDAAELAWMTRHALRTQIKAGAPRALQILGFDPDIDLDCRLALPAEVCIGDALTLEVTLTSPHDARVLVDFVLYFATQSGRPRSKVFKLKEVDLVAGKENVLTKSHRMKGNATTFRLHPGPHRVDVQVNGRVLASGNFDLSD